MTIETTTIVALSTPQGEGGIAVIRLSGPQSKAISENISNISIRESRKSYFCKILDNRAHLDDVLIIYFHGPASYTGEDVVEISCHGSTYITERIIELCIKNGATLAQAGEFTKRGFLNGKMDLSQAEGVADLIASKTKAAHQASTQLLDGITGKKIKSVQKQLIDVISLLELELDFMEQEIDFTPLDKIGEMILTIISEIDQLIDSYKYGKLLKEGLKVPIIGSPNSGKSSLMNSFLQEERVIVSSTAGTTRDSIEESFRRGGFQFRLIDTAGLRETNDDIEHQGILRTKKHIDDADIILRVIDPNEKNIQIKTPPDKTILVFNKMDLHDYEKNSGVKSSFSKYKNIAISAKNHTNIHELADLMVDFTKTVIPVKENVIISRKRHWENLKNSRQSLLTTLDSVKENLPQEIIIVDLRIALDYLDKILGKTSDDDILNNIFGHFCIGK